MRTIFLFLILFSAEVFAARILKIKDRRVLVQLDGLVVQEGLNLTVTSVSAGAVLKVTKIKGNMAAADVVTGEPIVGQQVSLSSTSIAAPGDEEFADFDSQAAIDGSPKIESPPKGKKKSSKDYGGVVLSAGYNTGSNYDFKINGGSGVGELKGKLASSGAPYIQLDYLRVAKNALNWSFGIFYELERKAKSFDFIGLGSTSSNVSALDHTTSGWELNANYSFGDAKEIHYIYFGIGRANLNYSGGQVDSLSSAQFGFGGFLSENITYGIALKVLLGTSELGEVSRNDVIARLGYAF